MFSFKFVVFSCLQIFLKKHKQVINFTFDALSIYLTEQINCFWTHVVIMSYVLLVLKIVYMQKQETTSDSERRLSVNLDLDGLPTKDNAPVCYELLTVSRWLHAKVGGKWQTHETRCSRRQQTSPGCCHLAKWTKQWTSYSVFRF